MSLENKLMEYISALKTDFPAALKMVAEDVVWINYLPDNVPFGGEYRGHEGLIEYFQTLTENFEIGQYVDGSFEFIESGNTLVFIGAETGARVLSTGKVFDLPFVWVVKWNDEGKICYAREHNDTAAIGDAFKE